MSNATNQDETNNVVPEVASERQGVTRTGDAPNERCAECGHLKSQHNPDYKGAANPMHCAVCCAAKIDCNDNSCWHDYAPFVARNWRQHWHPDWTVSLNAARALVVGDPKPESLMRMYGLLCIVTAILGEFEPTPLASDSEIRAASPVVQEGDK